MMDRPITRKCKCGYVHPAPWDDKCPMISQSAEDSNEISSFMSKLTEYLYNSENPKEIMMRIVEAINKKKG